MQSQAEVFGQHNMLPPSLGNFPDREDLITHVREWGASQGYVVTIKKSKRNQTVLLGCDRGGVYRNRRKSDDEIKRKRKTSSRLINCPFEAIGKKDDDVWVLTIKDGTHNHEPLKDMSEHPYSRRFTEEEVREIKKMTDAGVKPLQMLKALKKKNPELQSTARHLYNVKAKIRHGNFSEKSFKTWRPNSSALIDRMTTLDESLYLNPLMKVRNFIGGKFVDSQASAFIDVLNPATQEVVSRVPLTTYEEFKEAVKAAKKAFLSWRNTPVTMRQRIMFKLRELIQRDIDKLAMNITIEQGKTLKGSRCDVLRGLEAVENACGMATLQMGEFLSNAPSRIDTYSIREPLGVCAGICPINFSAMSSLRMFPIAVTCGNTFVLRPCEKNPGASMILATLAKEAGLPDGVLNIVHGTTEIANYICDDADIKAVTSMGSDVVDMHIYARAAAKGKHVQSNSEGKNYAIIMPDANVDATLNALLAAGFGSAGQRSMTLSTAVFVGGSLPWEEKLVERAKALELNAGTVAEADIGPVISKEVQDHISTLVQKGVVSGARLLLDGRNAVVSGYENGNFVGPTILCDVAGNMDCYKVELNQRPWHILDCTVSCVEQEEFFGPVLLCIQANSLEEAITLVNRDRPVNGASIFTTCRFSARNFQNQIEATLVGVNVPVPVLLPPSSFNRSEASFSGDVNFCGKASVQFYTRVKIVLEQWRDLPSLGLSSSDTDMAGQSVSSALHRRSDRDSPSDGDTPSDGDSPSEGPTLVNPGASSCGLSTAGPTPRVLSQQAYVERRLSNHAISLTSERDLALSKSLYTSQWNDLSREFQRSDHVGGERNGNAFTSESLYMSHRNSSDVGPSKMLVPPIFQRNAPMERMYMPASSQTMYTAGMDINSAADQGPPMTLPSRGM